MELVKIGKNTYYLKNPTNIGIYKIDDYNVYLIDSGNDKDAGKKILKIIENENWQIKGIINTHSNADHIGGNKIIQEKTKCSILASDIERAFIKHPFLEPAFLYGGNPIKELENKFLMAKSSLPVSLENNLPDGLEIISLPGHFYEMIGIKTSDDVYFLADSLFSEDTILKYHIFYIYNVKEYLNTLDYLATLDGKFYVPSHGNITSDITNLINLNRNKINEICEKICKICVKEKTFEEILQELFLEYNLTMNLNQYVLIGSTVKSFLSYLNKENKLKYEFKDCKMLWQVVD